MKRLLLTGALFGTMLGGLLGFRPARSFADCSYGTAQVGDYCLCTEGSSYSYCNPGEPTCDAGGFCCC
jgi:hypothetical protein